MSIKYPSDLFNRFWWEKLSEVGKKIETVTFQQIVDDVWKPVFDRCIHLLDDLKSEKLTLSDVDSLFNMNYSSDQDSLRRDLLNLYMGTQECINKFLENSQWIQSVVDHIVQYWNLCSYYETARAFIEIRKALHLTGDFSLVEKVASQVE